MANTLPAPRSWLFTPGSRPDRFAKAIATSADMLILDLEDAVAEDAKTAARRNVVALLTNAPDLAPRICVRINSPGRVVGMSDLIELASLVTGPRFILLPKVEGEAELVIATRLLEDAGSAARLAALVESGRGVMELPRIVGGSDRLAALLFGAADYAADLGQQVGAFDASPARSALVNAAAAGGLLAIDSPTFTIDDSVGLAEDCAQSRRLGFFGKAAIHPAQLSAIEAAFAPRPEDVAHAKAIQEARTQGVSVVGGRMVDVAMVRWATRIAG